MNVSKNTIVSEIMTKNPITVDVRDNLHEVEKLMKDNNIHHIPVMENEKIVGKSLDLNKLNLLV